MRLLLDSDILCKLGAAGLIRPLLKALGVQLEDCRRLPALPHMLRRGALRNRLGIHHCDTLQKLAQSIQPSPDPPTQWLDLLTPIPQVDIGEAQLLAVAAADGEHLLATSDKRALKAIAPILELTTALNRRVITLEAALLLLCRDHGETHIRSLIRPAMNTDTVFRTCFSSTEKHPIAALSSYFRHAERELSPLCLWRPDGDLG